MKQGFSLVELSIVLVILGLLVGGIMTGQNLIRAAELRSINTEMQQYQTAVNLFKEKYFALPGDMSNATKFWGKADNLPATCRWIATTDTSTCDGDGNGAIRFTSWQQERFAFWKHLANARLITGNFTGAGKGAAVEAFVAMAGVNAPPGKLSGSVWHVYWAGDYGGSSSWYAMDYGNVLRIDGSETGAEELSSGAPLLTVEEVWNIDVKVDDGKPAMGRLVTNNYNDCTIGTSNNQDHDGDYDLAASGQKCHIMFRHMFE